MVAAYSQRDLEIAESDARSRASFARSGYALRHGMTDDAEGASRHAATMHTVLSGGIIRASEICTCAACAEQPRGTWPSWAAGTGEGWVSFAVGHR